MLLPQFSFRTLLIGVALAAVVSLAAASAVNGQQWALAAFVGAGSIVVCFGLFFFAFAAAFVLSGFIGVFRRRKRATPFSPEAPRQVLPTHDAE